MNIETIITRFEAYLLTEKRVSLNTLAAYRRDIAQFKNFLSHHAIQVDRVTLHHLKDFLHVLHKQALSARTIARKISALKILFIYLHKHYEYENVAKHLCMPKLERSLPRYLTSQEIEKLFHAIQFDTSTHALRNKVILYLLYASGMRISELVSLEISHIHADTGMVRVSGKGGKERIIPLPETITQLLVTYINSVHKDFERKHTCKATYLLPVVYGGKIKPISRQACWGILNKAWELTDIKRSISPHQLRHSLATHMLKNGANLRVLQQLLGHESINTVQIYTHVEVSHLRTIYDKKHPRS